MAQPFDRLANAYDAGFTDTRLGRWLRRKVQVRLAEAFAPGQHLLELGCGTGEDAVWLAQRDITVTAVDASSEMLDLAQEKAARAGVENRITFRQLDLSRAVEGALARDPTSAASRFDGAFSNFGALNCLPERVSLAAELARRVRPGGRLVLVVMGPFCLWEFIGHLVRGRPRAAVRRFRPSPRAQLGGQQAVRVWYPSPRRLRRELAPHFRCLESVGIGLLLPPTDFFGLVERWPPLFATAAAIEDRLARLPPASWLSDHYLMTLERR